MVYRNKILLWYGALIGAVIVILGLGIVTGYIIAQGEGPGGLPDPITPTVNFTICDSDHCDNCQTQEKCENAGCTWDNDTQECEEPAPPPYTVEKETGKIVLKISLILGGKTAEYEIGTVDDLSIRKLSIDMKENGTAASQIHFTRLYETPEEVTEPEDNVYEYFNTSLQTVTNDDFNSATIEFAVSRDWIDANSIDATTVKLSRWDVDSLNWEELTTAEVSSDAEEITYSAVSSHLSIFSITGEGAAEICTGKVSLELDSTAVPEASVTSSVSGLSGCTGKKVEIRKDSCNGPEVCTISVSGEGGTCDFTAPDEEGTYVYYACAFLDDNDDFADFEMSSAAVEVGEAAEPSVTQSDADSAISFAQTAIDDAKAENRNVTSAEALLAEAESAYNLGDWDTAVSKANSAESAAISAAVVTGPAEPGIDFTVIILIVAIILVAVGAAGYFFMRKGKKKAYSVPKLEPY